MAPNLADDPRICLKVAAAGTREEGTELARQAQHIWPRKGAIPPSSASPPRAVLRPGLRLRPHPGNRLSGRSPHLGQDDPGGGPACGVVVGVGWIRVADQRRAGRGGDPCALGDPDGDGGHAGCLSSRPRRLRGAHIDRQRSPRFAGLSFSARSPRSVRALFPHSLCILLPEQQTCTR